MSVHFPQQAGWLRGEALVLNSKFLSADKKEKTKLKMKMYSRQLLITG